MCEREKREFFGGEKLEGMKEDCFAVNLGNCFFFFLTFNTPKVFLFKKMFLKSNSLHNYYSDILDSIIINEILQE